MNCPLCDGLIVRKSADVEVTTAIGEIQSTTRYGQLSLSSGLFFSPDESINVTTESLTTKSSSLTTQMEMTTSETTELTTMVVVSTTSHSHKTGLSLTLLLYLVLQIMR